MIAGIGITALEGAIGSGPKSLKEIALALHKFGYIDNVDLLLRGKVPNGYVE